MWALASAQSTELRGDDLSLVRRDVRGVAPDVRSRVYVLEGKGEAIIGSEVMPIKAGDFIGYRAGGEAHNIRNTGTEILKCIVVGQRLDSDVADYPDLKKRIYRSKGSKWNLVDFENIIG